MVLTTVAIAATAVTARTQQAGDSLGLAFTSSMKTPPGRLFANTVIMATLATLLSSHLDRPVIDGTNLDGRFDVQLEAAEIEARPGYRPGPSDLALPPAAGPSIFVAVREQLGLKLDAQVAPVSVLVVRGAERPRPD